MGYPLMSGHWPTHQTAQQPQFGTTQVDDMEVDNEDRPQPPPTRAEKGRKEAPPSRKMAKGRRRATPRDEEGDKPQDRYREVEEEHSSLLNLLEREGIRHIVAQEVVTNPSAVLAFSQLTTVMDDLGRFS